jgi:hypothetical protein
MPILHVLRISRSTAERAILKERHAKNVSKTEDEK